MPRLALGLLLATVLVAAQFFAVHAHRPALAAAVWGEICTADGLCRKPPGEEPAAAHPHDEHCPLCRLAQPLATGGRLEPLSPSPAADRVAMSVSAAFVARGPVRHDASPRAPPTAA